MVELARPLQQRRWPSMSVLTVFYPRRRHTSFRATTVWERSWESAPIMIMPRYLRGRVDNDFPDRPHRARLNRADRSPISHAHDPRVLGRAAHRGQATNSKQLSRGSKKTSEPRRECRRGLQDRICSVQPTVLPLQLDQPTPILAGDPVWCRHPNGAVSPSRAACHD